MIFGLDETGKKIKRAAAAAGVDKGTSEKWLRFYKRVKKNVPAATNRYHQVRIAAQRILSEAQELEQIVRQEPATGDDAAGSGALTADQRSRITQILGDFKKTQPLMDYEFIISRADAEFHSTLESVMRLGGQFVNGKADRLLLQSEIENLIAYTREGIEKKKPDLFPLAVFYLDHTDAELEKMSYSMRLDRVEEIFQESFRQPAMEILTPIMACGMDSEKTDSRLQAKLEPVVHGTQGSAAERAESFLKQLTRI